MTRRRRPPVDQVIQALAHNFNKLADELDGVCDKRDEAMEAANALERDVKRRAEELEQMREAITRLGGKAPPAYERRQLTGDAALSDIDLQRKYHFPGSQGWQT